MFYEGYSLLGCHAVYLFMYYYYSWVETEPTWYCCHYLPVVPAPDDRWWWLWSNWWNEDWQGKPNCPSATLSTTQPTWTDLGFNPAAAVGSRRLTAWAMARPRCRIIGVWCWRSKCFAKITVCWDVMPCHSSCSSSCMPAPYGALGHGLLRLCLNPPQMFDMYG
jgi:hypothetical protein